MSDEGNILDESEYTHFNDYDLRRCSVELAMKLLGASRPSEFVKKAQKIYEYINSKSEKIIAWQAMTWSVTMYADSKDYRIAKMGAETFYNFLIKGASVESAKVVELRVVSSKKKD